MLVQQAGVSAGAISGRAALAVARSQAPADARFCGSVTFLGSMVGLG